MPRGEHSHKLARELREWRAPILQKALDEGWTLKELGAALKVTRERARQLLQRENAVINDNYVSLRRLCACEYRVSRQMEELCKEYVVYRGVKQSAFVHLNNVEAVQQKIKEYKKFHNCRRCGVRIPRKGYKQICSSCRQVPRLSTKQQGLAGRTNAYAEQRHTRLAPIIAKKTKKKGAMIGIAAASNILGLSKMQLQYLGWIAGLSLVPHPTKTWRGLQPQMMFYENECIALREALDQPESNDAKLLGRNRPASRGERRASQGFSPAVRVQH